MFDRIEKLKEAVETLKTDELRGYLLKEINNARIESINSQTDQNDILNLMGTKENKHFDRVFYFHELTKHLTSSIKDCDEKLERNKEEWEALCLDIENEFSQLNNIKSSLVNDISGILGTITDGRVISYVAQEPLGLLFNDIKKEEPLTLSVIRETIEKTDYKPYGVNKLYSKFYIKHGEYEIYCGFKESALKTIKLLESTELDEKVKSFNETCELKLSLEQNPSIIRSMQIEWRNSLMTCFNVKYDKSKLTTASLLMS